MSKLSKVVEVVINNLISQVLSDKNFSWNRTWENIASGGLPFNVISKRQYSGFNLAVLMFYSSIKGTNQFITFKQVTSKGFEVKTGAKSIPILFYNFMFVDPMTGKKYSKNSKAYKELSSEILSRLKRSMYMTYYNVFAITDTTMPEIKVEKSKKVVNPIKAGQQIVDVYKTMCNIKIGIDNSKAFYSPGADFINLPDINAFENAESFYHVAFHEIAHSTGHKNRLNRKIEADSFKEKYSKEELVAELTANMVSAKINILNKKLTDNSTAYLQGWSRKLIDRKQELFLAMTQAANAFQYIVDNTKS